MTYAKVYNTKYNIHVHIYSILRILELINNILANEAAIFYH